LDQLSLNLQTNQNIIFAITFSAFMIHFVEFQAILFPSVASYSRPAQHPHHSRHVFRFVAAN